MPYGRFIEELSSRSIQTLGDWCTTCQSEKEFCTLITQSNAAAGSPSYRTGTSLSNGVAGIAGTIGAAVALAVIAILGGAAWLVLRRKTRKSDTTLTQRISLEKQPSDSERSDAV